MLKSLVDWEKSRRQPERKRGGSQSLEEDSARESVEIKSREDVTSNFEKAKAHKSTMEAAISEVIDWGLYSRFSISDWKFSAMQILYWKVLLINPQFLRL